MIEDDKHYMQHTEPQPITPEYEAKMRADYEAVRVSAESFGATLNARYVRDLLVALGKERDMNACKECFDAALDACKALGIIRHADLADAIRGVVRERDENESAFKIWRRRTIEAECQRDEALAKIPEERAKALSEVADLCDGEFPDFTKWLRSLAEAESKKGKVA